MKKIFLSIINYALLISCTGQIKISQLPSTTSVNGAISFPILQGTTTKKMTLDVAKFYLQSAFDARYPSNADLASKQPNLISGTNIKTVNGTSLLGSGNISISGGGGAAWYSYVNVQNYGAIPNDGLDDYAAIQSAVNYAAINNIRRVVLPYGDYLSSNTIQIIAGGSVSPTAGYVTLDITGESNFWNTGGLSRSSITLTVKDRPLIAIQRGEGCHITNLSLIGSFRARNPSTDRYAFFNTTAANFVNDGSRDNPFSPNCGVAIDPYWPTNDSTWKGAGNWFPSLGKYYGLGYGTGGTGTVIENCQIDGFVIGVASSLNVEMLNAEITIIRKVSFGNGTYYGLKWCVIGTQAQEKVNLIKECSAWSQTYGFFSNHGGYNGVYGYGRTGEGSTESGNWNIEDINIANAMVKFCDVKAGGWFPVYVNRVYGEGVGSIGSFSGNSSVFSNSMIDFDDPTISGYKDWLYCENPGTVFTGNTFRFYGSNGYLMPTFLNRGLFSYCNFSGVPYISSNGIGYPARFENCTVENSGIPFGEKSEAGIYKSLTGVSTVYHYGNTTLSALDYNYNQLKENLTMKDYNLTKLFYMDVPYVPLTITGHTTTFTHNYPAQFSIDGLVDFWNNLSVSQGFGRVTSINGTTITVSYISPNLTTGSYRLMPIYPNYFSGTFVGDLFNNAGVQEIRNVQMDWGTGAAMVGKLIYEPKFSTNYQMKIIAWDGVNKFTVATGNVIGVAANANNLYFSNNTRKSYESVTDGGPSANVNRIALQKNSVYTTNKNSDLERNWKVLTSGFNSGSPLATWVEQ
jgi:hypothetical protein